LTNYESILFDYKSFISHSCPVLNMGKTNKTLAIFLTLIIAMSCLTLLIVKPANAQSIPKPSVPEFTLQVVKSTSIVGEYGVQMAIHNQATKPNDQGKPAFIYYDIRIKEHNSENWVNYTAPNPSQGTGCYIAQSGTSLTILYKDINSIKILLGLSGKPYQIDFQVEAISGYLNSTPPPINLELIIVNTSGWSATQTIGIPATTLPNPTPTMPNSGPTSSPTTTPSVPEFSWLAILPILLTTSIALAIVRKKPRGNV
jgi:hypothetical protein